MLGYMTDAPLISTDTLQASLTDRSGFDTHLADWVLGVVSNTARVIANRLDWTAENIPPAAKSAVSMAARRLYTNPDRFTREASGDYSYGLDPSVTHADVFTPTEVGTLRKYAPGTSRASFGTLSTTRGDAGAPAPGHGTVYVPDGSRDGFPWYSADGYHGLVIPEA